MKKYVFIIVSIVILVGIVAFGISMFSNKKQAAPDTDLTGQNSGFGQTTDINTGQQNGNATGNNVATSTTSGGSISVATISGSTLQVRNFLSDPTTYKDPLNPGQWYLGYHFPEVASDTMATEDPPYVIAYSDSDQSFDIGLFQEPISSVRVAAEQDLLNRLVISQDQMCELKYTISVPNRVNQYYAGANLGFSFCPGAVKLAQ